MKRILISLALLASLISGYAHATTYSYTGDNFTSATGVYSTAMRITGTITTSSPIPPDSAGLNISGLLTSWSFSDGVQTINSANGVIYPAILPQVTTDSSGNIVDVVLYVFSDPIGVALDDLDNLIWIAPGINYGAKNGICTGVSGGVCSAWTVPDLGQAFTTGVWVTGDLPVPPIPTMTQWSLMLMALLLGMVGIARVRR